MDGVYVADGRRARADSELDGLDDCFTNGLNKYGVSTGEDQLLVAREAHTYVIRRSVHRAANNGDADEPGDSASPATRQLHCFADEDLSGFLEVLGLNQGNVAAHVAMPDAVPTFLNRIPMCSLDGTAFGNLPHT